MKCYVVIYDLKQPTQEYTELWEELKSHNAWGKLTDSSWAVVTEENAVEIRNHLAKFIGKEDRLFVVKSGGSAAWYNPKANKDWLKKNLAKV
ncbi:MAG: SinR family protein [Bacteroidetes bacterium]|nr:MAG: SinR family protein [Bacteroidota bacterium]